VERIGASITEKHDEVTIAPRIEDGHPERCVAEPIGLVDLGTAVEQEGGSGHASALRREVQRGEPLPVAEVDGVTCGQARLDRRDVAV
jgi:hypothetical protein